MAASKSKDAVRHCFPFEPYMHHPQLNLIGLLHRSLNLLQLKQSQHKNRDDGRIAKHPNEVVAKGVRLHHLFRRKIRKIKN